MTRLTNLLLMGWKSIQQAQLVLRPLNVLIGANGAGKSNLISFFKLLNETVTGRFQLQVGIQGGAESLLHFGQKRTSSVDASFKFVTDQGHTRYGFRLVPAAGNTLLFSEETIQFYQGEKENPHSQAVTRGNPESLLSEPPEKPPEPTPLDMEALRSFLIRCQVFHFHDTSPSAALRRDCYLHDNRSLHADAGNLAAMLYLYHERYPAVYRRIVAAVKAVAPFFEDFALELLRLNPRNVILNWRAKGEEYKFGPHQFSDGMLRAIALFTLLLQPEEDLPALMILDEPELGLHPAAVSILADLVKGASRHCQVLLATQSATLLDHFDPEDVIVVNLRDGQSVFERLEAEPLRAWLEDEYALSNLWERNVIGGGPY